MIRKIFVLCVLLFGSSCALMFNDDRSTLSIVSDPAGADVIIEGRSYGRTPIMLNIKPGKYNVSLVKEGHGSATFSTDAIQGIEKGPDGNRCLLDGVGSVFVITFYSAFISEKCSVFKENYDIKIPFTSSRYRNINKGASYPRSYDRYMQKKRKNRKSVDSGANNTGKAKNSTGESYNENDLFIRQGYGRSPRLPIFGK